MNLRISLIKDSPIVDQVGPNVLEIFNKTSTDAISLMNCFNVDSKSCSPFMKQFETMNDFTNTFNDFIHPKNDKDPEYPKDEEADQDEEAKSKGRTVNEKFKRLLKAY